MLQKINSLDFEHAFDKEKGDVGDRFQTFVFDVFRRSGYPNLHKFPTPGNDGSIDLILEHEGKRTVFECKFIGDNDIRTAQKRWREEIRNRLQTNLSDVTKTKKLYRPWLNTYKPISKYIYCVSADIKALDGFDVLTEEIQLFFSALAQSRPHLKHLERLEVEIIDRQMLLERLESSSSRSLIFKWFPVAEKFGFTSLHSRPESESFRAFLNEGSLPFYDRRQHLRKNPDTDLQDEGQMLSVLDGSHKHGLIISGSGGEGKTRLTLELGRLAEKKGWIVLRCGESVTVDRLNKFAETLADNSKILFLMDYVEIQKYFRDVTEGIKSLNENHDFQLKYIANCRASYYRAIDDLPNHQQISLSRGKKSKADKDPFDQYQAAVAHHILERGGIVATTRHLAVCKNKPIIAVFIIYLHLKKRDELLENLLDEEDFGRWIRKRIKISFTNLQQIEMRLARLVALFPFSDPLFDRLDELDKNILKTLAKDGWIENLAGDLWRNIQDVFADQIIISYLDENPDFKESLIRDIFSFAIRMDNLEAAFTSVQRVKPNLDIDFYKFLEREIDNEPAGWKKIRNLLLETSLLEFDEKLELLSKDSVWTNSEDEQAFQSQFASLLRHASQNRVSLAEAPLATVKNWLAKVLDRSPSNFLLTWGLRFSPEETRHFALERIQSSSGNRDGHLLSAWLDSGLPAHEIESFVRKWVERFGWSKNASFVYKSWLEAKGDPEFVKGSIRRWLAKNRTIEDAQFVYNSWLDAKGDPEFVKGSIRRWLAKNRTVEAAQFVYQSWLVAKGDPEFVKGSIRRWLATNRTIEDAQFVYNSWLDAKGDPEFVKGSIRRWLAKNGTIEDAQFVYNSWLDAEGDPEFVKGSIRRWLAKNRTVEAAGYLYSSWLNAKGDPEFVKGSIRRWLVKNRTIEEAQFVYKSWLEAKGDPEFVKDDLYCWLGGNSELIGAGFPIKAWLTVTRDYEFVRASLNVWMNRYSNEFEADHTMRAWLDAGGDFDFIKKFAANWLAVFYNRFEAVYVTKRLSVQHDLPIETVRHILLWCAQFPQAPENDAIWRLTRLREKALDRRVSTELLDASEAIVGFLLLTSKLSYETKGQICNVFFNLFSNPGLQNSDSINRIKHLFLEWIKYPDSYGINLTTYYVFQSPLHLERFASLLDESMIDLIQDRPAVERFLRHFNNWFPEKRAILNPLISELRTKYPSNVWDVVIFDNNRNRVPRFGNS